MYSSALKYINFYLKSKILIYIVKEKTPLKCYVTKNKHKFFVLNIIYHHIMNADKEYSLRIFLLNKSIIFLEKV